MIMFLSSFQETPRIKRFFLAFGLVVPLLCSACSSVTTTHGYVPAQTKPSDIQAGTDTKATVLAQLGNPSTTDVFEKEIWYYISSTRKERAFFKPKITERRVVSVIFDETGAVSDVGEYGLKDGIVVAYIKRKTPTRGRELSTLQQILGNIGRLPQSTLGGNNSPGGGN